MASRTPPVDPRIATPPPSPAEETEAGVRPVVALPRSGPSGFVFLAIAVVAAIILFIVLDSRRRPQVEPAVQVRGPDARRAAGNMPPPLYIPPTAPPETAVAVPTTGTAYVAPPPPATVYRPAREPSPPPVRIFPAQPTPMAPVYSAPPPPPRVSNSPTVVIDTTSAAPSVPAAVAAAQAAAGDGPGGLGDAYRSNQSVSRVRAGMIANRATSVIQGTLIPAVLETAFDSRRPGFARAIVSRDVRGFDGSQVLIPRGSRLTGEYRSDIQPGQKRALINWTRLIRPDGVTIALGSPAADPLGRGGVRGDYNSHFFERFSSALLQTAIQVGAGAASRAASGSVVVALPGSTQNVSPLLQSTRVVPTLTVPAGTSISVFVARDLDFTRAGRSE